MEILTYLRLSQIYSASPHSNSAAGGKFLPHLLGGLVGLSILGITGSAIALQSGSPALAASASLPLSAVSPPAPPSFSSPASRQLLLSQRPAADTEIQLGDSGELVSDLQSRLTELGYYTGPISGSFGSLTQEAVAAFQRDSGLIADGIVGAATTEALRRTSPGGSTLQLGSSGSQVREIQAQLAELGYYTGPLTGYYGQLTEDAVIRFQQSQGLLADGVLGSATLAALDMTAAPPPASSTTANRPASAPTPTPSPTVQPTVLDLQRRLQQQGFYTGPLDGILGPATQSAIEAAQRSYRLNNSDVVTP